MRKAILLATVALAAAAPATQSPASGPAPVPPSAQAASTPLTQTSDPFVGRPDQLPPALRIMQANNVKLTSLGDEGGLHGYLLEDSSGKMQVVYLTPDGKGMVVGVLQSVTSDGRSLQNVTTLQFAALRQRFDDAKRRVEDQQKAADEARRKADAAAAALMDQQRQIGEASRQFDGTGTTAAPATITLPASAPVRSPTAAQPPSPPPVASSVLPVTPVPVAPVQPTPSPAASVAPQGTPTRTADSAARWMTSVDKGQFLADVEHVAFFPVGRPDAPTVYMVADPQCPHCHLAWSQLKPLVASGALAVRVILIGALPGSEPLAVKIASQPNPAESWWKGEGSEDGHAISTGAPDGSEQAATARGYIASNMDYVRNNKITGTPWMAYVGKDGKVYEMAGDRDISAFLGAL